MCIYKKKKRKYKCVLKKLKLFKLIIIIYLFIAY